MPEPMEQLTNGSEATSALLADIVSAIPVTQLSRSLGTTSKGAALSDGYRIWQVEDLLNEASELADRCIGLKQLADELWARDAEISIQLALDRRADDLAKYEEEHKLEDAQLRLVATERHGLFGTTFDTHQGFDTGHPVKGYAEALKDWWTHARRVGSQGVDPVSANGNISADNAVIAGVVAGTQRQLLAMREHLEPHFAYLRAAQRRFESEIRTIRRSLSETIHGPLNFDMRAQVIVEKLLAPTFRDLRERCNAAHAGLKAVFGLDDSAAPPDVWTSGQTGTYQISPTFAEDYSAWVRDAVRFVAKFGSTDVGYGLTFSLRQLIEARPEAKFEVGRSYRFRLRPDDFPYPHHCRIRGVGATVVGREGEVWSLELKVPSRGQFFTANNRSWEINQQDVPICVLGRVHPTSSNRETEIAGRVALANVSPFEAAESDGWELEVLRSTGQSLNVDDVLIELRVVGHSGPAPAFEGR